MKYFCCITGQEIPAERVEALRFLEIPQERWTVVEASQEKPKKGLWSGEVGTSELIICKEVAQDGIPEEEPTE